MINNQRAIALRKHSGGSAKEHQQHQARSIDFK